MLRPKVRIPVWVAVAVVAAAYIVRSIVRGLDFRPDLPLDAILGLALLGLVGLRVYLSRPSPDDVDEHPDREMHQEDTEAGGEGHDDDV